MLNIEDFVDIFINEVNEVKDMLMNYFSLDTPQDIIEERVRYEFLSHWISLERLLSIDDHKLDEYSIIAVDSSYQGSWYAHGKALHIIRAVAIDDRGRTFRHLMLEYNASQRPRTISNVVKLLAEASEYNVCLKAVRDIDKPPIVLLDGSLYSRLAHPPVEYLADRHKHVYIETMRSFIELIDEVGKKGGILVGVVKDSTSEHLRLAILKNIILSFLPELEDVALEGSISKLFKMTSKELRKIDDDHVKKALRKLLNKLRFRESDYSIIMRYAERAGFTRPLLVGCLRSKCFKKFTFIEKVGILSFVLKTWKRHMKTLDKDSREEFKREACSVMLKLKSIPAIFTSYVLPRANELPLRIDVLMPQLELKRFFFFNNVNFVNEEPPSEIFLIVKKIVNDYADLTMYNPLLFAVHRMAKITRREFKLYEIALRNMGVNLIPKRRVWVA